MSTGTTFELHALIHSLSPSEKRYVKLFANFSGQKPHNNYIRLFDHLNALAKYDEACITDWVSQTSFASHLSTTVNLLTRLILRSLKLFHADKTRLGKAREAYDFAELLRSKGKYKMAQRFLRRARKMAEELEAETLLLEIYTLEKQLVFKMSPPKMHAQLEVLQEAQAGQLTRLQEKVRVSGMKDRHRVLRRKDSALRAPERQALLAHLRDQELPLVPQPAGFEAQLCYHALHSQIAVQARAYDKAHQEARKNIQLWEQHPRRIQTQPGLYVQYLSDYLNTCILALEKSEAEGTIARILEVKVHTHDDKIELLKQSLATQLVFCLNAGDQERGEAVIANIEQLLALHRDQIPRSRQLSFHFNITTFHFYSEAYSLALRALKPILHAPHTDLRQGLRSFARIFQIVLHYELDNLDLAEYLLRATRNQHQRRQQMFPLEKEIFRTLRALIFAPDPASVRESLRVQYEKLLSLAENPTGKEPAGTWEFIFWLESKVTGRALREIYLERVTARWNLALPGKKADQ